MASPVDAGRATTSVTAAASPWTVNLPGSIAAGDLLLALLRGTNGNAATLPAGWSWLVNNDATDATDDRTSVLYRGADGTEGATLSTSWAANQKGAALTYRITGAADPAIQVPEVVLGVGTGASADPSSITPTGGSKEYLILTYLAIDGVTWTGATPPASYANGTFIGSGSGGAVASNCRTLGASRQLTAASEDPGTFNNPAPNAGWTALTIAIHPSAAQGKPQLIVPQAVNRGATR